VIGDKANAVAVDEERGREYAGERVAQGVTAAALLESFGGQGERAGFSSTKARFPERISGVRPFHRSHILQVGAGITTDFTALTALALRRKGAFAALY
jgi:hypothetical protein